MAKKQAKPVSNYGATLAQSSQKKLKLNTEPVAAWHPSQAKGKTSAHTKQSANITKAQVSGTGGAFRRARLTKGLVEMHKDFRVEPAPFFVPHKVKEQGEAGFVKGVAFKMDKALDKMLANHPMPMDTTSVGDWEKRGGGWYKMTEDLTREMKRLSINGSVPQPKPGTVPAPPVNNLPLAPIVPSIAKKSYPQPVESNGPRPMSVDVPVSRVMQVPKRPPARTTRGATPAPQPPPPPQPAPLVDVPMADATLVDRIPDVEILGMEVLPRRIQSVLELLGGRYI